jgi:plastocyanin
MRTACLAAFLSLGAGVLSAGDIVGTVTAHGPAVAAPSGGGEYQSRRYSLAERIDYAHLQDFVIYIDQPVAEAGAPERPATVTQHDVSFEPHVLPIVVGQKVRWPNQDAIFHNVFSMSDAKAFDLGLYTQDRVPEILFDQVGRVDVYCSIHAKMQCIILVLPSPYFAKSDARGRYVIRHVPAGTYALKAWQERLPPSRRREIVVPAVGEVRMDFALGLGELPKY